MTVLPLNLDFIAGFQRGSYESVKDLYDLFYTDLAGFAEKSICHAPAAHEIVLETFVKLYRMRMQFNDVTNIKAYLYITVRNICQRYNAAAPPVIESLPWYKEDAIIDDAVRARAIDQFWEEVGALPQQCRHVFQSVFCRRLNIAEAAAQLDMDQPLVVQQRKKAIQQLRDNLYRKQLFSVPLFVYFLAVACNEPR